MDSINFGKKREILPFIFVGRGMLLGLGILIPSVVLLSKWEEISLAFSEFSVLPIISNISRDFKTGIEIAGDLYKLRSSKFYDTETKIEITDIDEVGDTTNQLFYSGISNIENEAATVISTYNWQKDKIREKLEKEFSNKKMKFVDVYLDYIEKHLDLAAREMVYSKVPASITLSQGLLESDAGQSFLARKANNHFGIKCVPLKTFKKDAINKADLYKHSLSQDCIQRKDDYHWDHFEVYPTSMHSYRRHTLLLAEGKRYSWMTDKYFPGEMYEVNKKWFGVDKVPYYAAWAIGLKESGYATNKRYAQKLALIIETYELWRIDYTVIFNTVIASNKSKAITD